MKVLRRPLFATLAAAVLAVRLLAPDVGHMCAATSSVPASAQEGVPDAEQETVSGAHHMHSAATATAAQGDHAHDATTHLAASEQSSPNPGHDCDCDTSCCCVATVATWMDAPALVVANVAIVRVEIAPPAQDRQPAWVAHVLPYNTPPPRVALS
jgi:hypothetical protein